MGNVENVRKTPRLRNWLFLLFAGLGGVFPAGGVYAFTPASSPLLSSAAVTPNVILLVDNSGSMNSIIWAAGFDPTATPAPVWSCSYANINTSRSKGCLQTAQQVASDTNIQLSELPKCSTGVYAFATSAASYYTSTTSRLLCLTLPDPVGNDATRYSTAYLAYLIALANNADKDFTVGNVVPTDYRINVARTVSNALITANRSLRIGLSTFYAATNSVSARGGYIAQPIADLQATSQTTAAAANTNFTSLKSAVTALAAVANTPLAETYYEVTRYFRGLIPYWGPGTTPYVSPIQYRCQKNYGVVITDGFPTFDHTFPPQQPIPQSWSGGRDPAETTTQKLPDWDNNSLNDGANPSSGNAEGDSFYLDDIAQFAYDIDMRTGTPGTSELEKKSWDSVDFPKQNLQTYTVGFTASSDMLADAATNGKGKYYLASDAASLTTALTAALNSISSQAGSGGAGSTSSSSLTSSTAYYQTLYDPTDWHGTIRAYALGSDGTLNSNLSWTTDTTMSTATTPAVTPTFESWNTLTNKPITLALGNLSPAQQTSLATPLPTGANATTYATSLVNWAKGINSSSFKTRTALLGDVISSTLAYASPTVQTATDLVGDNSYSTFLASKSGTTTGSAAMAGMLVVNANDGLTNVLRASDGARLYAYMPSTVLPSLYMVADPAYINGTSHKFLDDGQIGIYDAQVNGGWKTLAVGGTGAGGRSFYALQLYDGSAAYSTKAIWEISAPTANTAGADFNDLGYAYSKPEVAKLADGTWAAFIGNGYGSNSGVAALYVINLGTGALIKKIIVDSTNTNNGLGSVKLLVNSSNVVQAAYGGDLGGRMWKFDLSNTDPTAWTTAFSGKPLFTTTGTAQPITAQPLLVANPTSGYMVYFGTGKFNEVTDKTTTALQSAYGIWDAANSSGNFTVTNLQAQQITGSFSGSSGQYMTTSSNTVDYTTKKGWYLPLSYGSTMVGERVIYQASYTLGRILFTTAGVDSTDPCASQGFGRLVEIDALSGAMLTYPVLDTNGDGLVDSKDTLSSGLIFSTGIPSLNAIVDVPASKLQRKIVNDSSAKITVLTEAGNPSSGGGRIMWRQIQ
jgi:type IV pilus assembly protein PilY1